MKVPIVGGTYTAYAQAQNEQRTINWYPELVPDGENDEGYVLNPTPGLKSPIAIGGVPRGAHVMGGIAYVVYGTSLYSVSNGGTITTIGTVAGSERISMSDDGSTLTITTGSSGYVYDGTTFAAITDPDYVTSNRHNRFTSLRTIYAGGNGQQFQISEAGDSGSVEPLDFASAEANPDDIVTLEINQKLVYFFGRHSVEIWQNTGAAFPFAAIQGAFIERGCIAEWSVSKLDGKVFWLGDDLNVYYLVGYERYGITPPGIAEKIATAANPDKAYSYSRISGGHAFYYLTFEEFTLVYDVITKMWHEVSSWSGTEHERWKVTHVYKAYGKEYGLHENGSVYEISQSYFYEDTTIVVRDRISEDISKDGVGARKARARQSNLEVQFQSGMGLGDGTTPYAMLRWSDDSGFTWSNEHWESMGKVGEYANRAIWNQLGSFAKQRRYWLRVSAPIKACVIDAEGDFR